jgi:hypothetical protein
VIELAVGQLLIARFSEPSGIAGHTYVQKVIDRSVFIGLFRFRFETLVYLYPKVVLCETTIDTFIIREQDVMV